MTAALAPAGVGWLQTGFRSAWVDRLLLVCFSFFIRSPGFTHSVIADWDEAMYALMARELLHGGLPYVTIFQEKPLGPTVFVAAFMWVLGESIWSLRFIGSTSVAVTALILRELALAGRLSRVAAVASALLYAAFSIELGGMASNLEILFAPFTAGAFFIALKYRHTQDFVMQCLVVLIAGLLFGLGIWFKYIAAFPGCILFAWLVGGWMWHSRLASRRAGLLAGIYLVACLLPTMATAAVYAWIGAWDAFWYCNIGFMPIYKGLSRPAGDIELTLIQVILATYGLVTVALLGVAYWRHRPVLASMVLGWLLAEVVALSVPWKFWDHYFLLLLPPVCLLAGIGIDKILLRLLPKATRERDAALPAVAMLLVAFIVAFWSFPRLYQRFDRPDPSRMIAEFLSRDPAATVWVINHEPIIYFLAKRPLPTIYVFPPHLVGTYSVLARTDPQAEIRRVLEAKPRYLILDLIEMSLILPKYAEMITESINADYELALAVPGRVDNIMVYRRRD